MSDPCEMKPVKPILDKIGTYYLQDYNEPIPVCKGCFNQHGPCGTPCFDCERKEAWNKEFIMYLYIVEQFVIYKRIIPKKESDEK